MQKSLSSPVISASAALLFSLSLAACGGAEGSSDSMRPKSADKWYQRAQQNFKSADVDEANDSVTKALSIIPADQEIRMLAARIALARLEFSEALQYLKGIKGTEAAGLRGRALWYKGDLERAADQLEAMLNDPDVKDEWAKSIAKLARRGAGRTPFTLSGGLLAALEMERISPDRDAPPTFIIELEIDGEPALAMISTGVPELVLDSSSRREPSWVSLRFGKRIEVSDVPALTQDLSGISRELGAPIKALLGVNLLRHLNITMDYAGHQFVVRTFSPPPPPNATHLNVYYYRGGGMVLRSGLSADKSIAASLLVDTTMRFPIALDQGGWKKAGLDIKDLTPIPQDPQQTLKQGVIPVVRLGAYDVPKVPGVYGPALTDVEKALTPLDLDGVVGAGLLAYFRITIGDGGQSMWIEDNSALQKMLEEIPSSLGAPNTGLEPPGTLGSPGLSPSNAPSPSPAPAPAPPAEKSPKAAPKPNSSKNTPDR